MQMKRKKIRKISNFDFELNFIINIKANNISNKKNSNFVIIVLINPIGFQLSNLLVILIYSNDSFKIP